MRREYLDTADSVAELFKVSPAKTRKRMVRAGTVDWELVTQVLRAAGYTEGPRWPSEPLEALLASVLLRTRPLSSCLQIMEQLRGFSDGWSDRLRDWWNISSRLGLTPLEAGQIYTLLRLLERHFPNWDLVSLRHTGDMGALRRLASVPGVDLPSAATVVLHCLGGRVLPPTQAVRTVLSRLGALPSGADEAALLKHLRSIPTTISLQELHIGLTNLYYHVCHHEAPACQECPLLKLCPCGRKTVVTAPRENALTFVDLFAGAGGMSYGLCQAGFRPLLAVEKDSWAAETYRVNHPQLPPDRVLVADITRLDPAEVAERLGIRRPDLVVGGPPCQGFSLIGKRGRRNSRFIDDPRNRLYKEFIRWIVHLRPRLVVMENVPGLYSYAEGAIRRDIELNLQEIGYAVSDLLVDASKFGVPQRRQRVLFIGACTDAFGSDAQRITERICEVLESWQEPEVTLEEAIGDLPPLRSGEGEEVVRLTGAGEPSGYARRMGAGKSDLLFHHVARPNNLRDLLLYDRLRPGETAEDVAGDARHLMVYRRGIYEDKYRKLRFDEPSPTIVSHLAKDGHMFIHPDSRQRRSITVREAARIQSFPDDFIFCGSRTHQFTQIGNAVPPLLAKALGEVILKVLSEVCR